MSELSYCCPQCGSVKSWYFSEGDYNASFDRFDKANPDTGYCYKCKFSYSEDCRHPLSEQIQEFRDKRKEKRRANERQTA